MPQYIRFPIEIYPDDLLDRVYDYIQGRFPSWTPNEGNLDVWLAQAMASEAADLAQTASDVQDDIFRYYGATVISLPPIDEAQASADSTWTMRDALGYTVAADTIVGIRAPDGSLVPFRTMTDFSVAPGSTATADGEVALLAVNPGADGSGLGGAGVPIELIDPLEFVASVTLTEVTTGGQDAEDDDVYLDRLVSHLRRLSLRPILPGDFAAMALDIPGVWRAVAIDNYNPADQTTNNERMVAVAGVDEAGNNLSGTIKTEIDNLLESNREVNFVVNVIDPTKTTIHVTFTGKAALGFAPQEIEDSAIDAVQNYLNPGTWGSQPEAGETGDPRAWEETTHVRYFDVAAVIENVTGFGYITSLQIGKQGGAMGTIDVPLNGVARLAVAGTISGDVT